MLTITKKRIILTSQAGKKSLRNNIGGVNMYSIDPAMSFGQVVCTYENYVDETRRAGKKPVSFLRFLTGRY